VFLCTPADWSSQNLKTKPVTEEPSSYSLLKHHNNHTGITFAQLLIEKTPDNNLLKIEDILKPF